MLERLLLRLLLLRRLARDELAAAAVRHPDAGVVVAPGLPEQARRRAGRPHERDARLTCRPDKTARSPGFDSQGMLLCATVLAPGRRRRRRWLRGGRFGRRLRIRAPYDDENQHDSNEHSAFKYSSGQVHAWNSFRRCIYESSHCDMLSAQRPAMFLWRNLVGKYRALEDIAGKFPTGHRYAELRLPMAAPHPRAPDR